MIPLIQNDYFKYHSMFRGNHVKGVTYFKSLLNTPETREQILSSVPALAAVFTDFSKNEATRLCYDLFKTKPYFETGVINYLRGLELTEHDNIDDLFNDIDNTFSLFRNSEIDPIINQSSLLLNSLKRQKTLKEIAKPENIDIMLKKEKLDALNSCASFSSVNTNSSFNTYWNTLNNITTNFAELEKYYDKETNEYWSTIDDEEEVMYMPARIATRYNNVSTYYHYPAVFKYDMKTAKWSLFYVADTDNKQTTNQYNSRTANALAYDKKNKHLYIFYKAINNNASVYCDIVDVTTQMPVVTKRLLGSDGSSNYQAPFYCIFDEKIGAAKYAWSANNMSIGSGASYGWLQGATVNANELIWYGKACHPMAEANMYSSYYAEIPLVNRSKMSNKHGAVVGTFQTSKDTSSSVSMFAIVKSEEDRLVGKYVATPTTCAYNTAASPNECTLLPDGIVGMKWDGIYWGGSNYRYVSILIDLASDTPKILYHNNGSYTFYLYPCFYFNKIIIYESTASPVARVCGRNTANSITQYAYPTGVTSMFNIGHLQYKGSDRYYMYSGWNIYDIERGLRQWN